MPRALGWARPWPEWQAEAPRARSCSATDNEGQRQVGSLAVVRLRLLVCRVHRRTVCCLCGHGAWVRTTHNFFLTRVLGFVVKM